MFGKRSTFGSEITRPGAPVAEPAVLPSPPSVPDAEPMRTGGSAMGPPASAPAPRAPAPPAPPLPSPVAESRRSDSYYEVKGTIFGALIEAIDLSQLARLDSDSAREEIRDIVNEIIAIKNIVMSISEQ